MQTARTRLNRHPKASLRTKTADTVVGDDVEVGQSAVRRLHANGAEIEQSALGLAQAGRMELKSSAALALVARDVQARNVNAVFLLSPRVTGTVRTVFDMRAAFAFGLGIVLGRQLLRLLRLR